jgi:hypothetical protein
VKLVRIIPLVLAIATLSAPIGALQFPTSSAGTKDGIVNIFGDWNHDRYHTGIDVPGNAGDDVYFPINDGSKDGVAGGYIIDGDPGALDPYQGYLLVVEKPGDTTAWKIAHIWRTPAEFFFQPWPFFVAAGSYMGEIAEAQDPLADHVHISKEVITEFYNQRSRGIFDPLTKLRQGAVPSQQPEIVSLFAVPDAYGEDYQTTPDTEFFHPNSTISGAVNIFGDVDFVSQARTIIEGDDRAGVRKISHWIEDSDGNVVVEERALMDFSGEQPYPTNQGLWTLYARDMTARYRSVYRISNCKNTLTPDQFLDLTFRSWQTNVREGEDDSDYEIDPTGQHDLAARLNFEAKYPDGEYEVTVKATAQNENTREKTIPVVIDNFAPCLRSL